MLTRPKLSSKKILLISDNFLLSEYLAEHISQVLATEVVIERSSIILNGRLEKVNAEVPLIVNTGTDISQRDTDYWNFFKNIKQRQIIFIADKIDTDLVHNLVEINALALIPTRFNQRLFTFALFLALQGEKYFPSEVWLPNLQENTKSLSELSSHKIKITKREYEVLEQLCEGNSNKVIARHLGLAEPTVKMHLAALSRKFKADNRTKLVCNVLQSGFFRNNYATCPPDGSICLSTNTACPYSEVYEGSNDNLNIP